MGAERSAAERHLALAACAVAVAAAVGSAPVSAKGESRAIDQIQRYCTTSWRNAGIDQQDWSDCTQQALLELLERVSRSRLGEAIANAGSTERRELNRTVWRTVQRWRRSPRWLPYHEGGSGSPPHADDTCQAWDDVMAASRECLSPRQQRILKLTRDGWRVGEIAKSLQLSPARVSDEKYKAICRLRDRLEATG